MFLLAVSKTITIKTLFVIVKTLENKKIKISKIHVVLRIVKHKVMAEKAE